MSGQGLESRQQSSTSPRSGGGDDLSKFSLLGQHFTRYNPAQHHGQSSQPASVGFSLLPSSQNHVPQQPLATPGHGGNSRGNTGSNGLCRSFSNLQNQQIPPLQGYNLAYGGHDINQSNFGENSGSSRNSSQSCNPQPYNPEVLLNTLSVLQQKIHHLQSLVPLIAQEDGQSGQSSTAMAQQQQEVTANVASIISQLMAAAAGMLPSSQQLGLNLSAVTTSPDIQLGHLFGAAPGLGLSAFHQNGVGNSTVGATNGPLGGNDFFGLEGGMGGPNIGDLAASSHSVPPQNSLGSSNPTHVLGTPLNAGPSNGKIISGVTNASSCHNGNGSANRAGNSLFTSQGSGLVSLDDNDFGGGIRDEDDDGEGENLPPGSYELVEMDAGEILAEHTHFCEICGKGFKRDANLRMHMRGHGDEYKTPAALARPDKAQDSAPVQPRRYSCPFVGCKRNKKHKKFQPLKTMLCVKNHYRRSHCPKMYTCNRCKNKKFSVVADLKTHEKHCGRDKWQCSCGTTFSRKDKLFGHIALFQGHTPALPPNEMEGSCVTDQGVNNGGAHSVGNTGAGFANPCGNISGLLAGSGIVGSSYANGNASSIGPGSTGVGLETGNGAVHGQMGLKNISFSEEGSGHAMGVASSSPMFGFPQSTSTLMAVPFMLNSLHSNHFLQQSGGN
eukprot:Gb_11550 [translate_table: standard]